MISFLNSMAFVLTDPIARKNENVAALLNMYWERVARMPRGPAPPLVLILETDYYI